MSEVLDAHAVARSLQVSVGMFRLLCSRAEFPEPDVKLDKDRGYRWKASTVAPWVEAYRLRREGDNMRRALIAACRDSWGGRGERYRTTQSAAG
ncbi:hypothetical protein [Burkholderia sp. WP9]|uniref:hypothetical protein n=1 Tax=Burkholderia sp. WP9 TaxID=1500263 RepID=UPI000B86CF39|nr:hypothetical protein [Burkholderia sp. WP9]